MVSVKSPRRYWLTQLGIHLIPEPVTVTGVMRNPGHAPPKSLGGGGSLPEPHDYKVWKRLPKAPSKKEKEKKRV
jgi:hypothetical protein